MRSKPLLLMGLTLTGCFDYATLQTNECFHGTCKDGLICVGGFCELPLNRDLSGQPDPADGSTQSGPDLRTRWDPAAVPVATPACTSGLGRPLNPTMVACAGAFPQQRIREQCNTPAGWVLCFSSQVPPADCAAVPWGFFATFVHGHDPAKGAPTPDAACTWSMVPAADSRHLYGCGTSASTRTYDAPTTCHAFNKTVWCNAPNSGAWSCPVASDPVEDFEFLNTANTDPKDGVLCCHN